MKLLTILKIVHQFIIQNEDIYNKTFYNNPFNFSFIGKLNNLKDIPNTNNTKLKMNEVDEKANCNFYKDENSNSKLECNLHLKDDIKNTDLTFEESEINIGDKSIFINGLNKVHFSYILNKEPKDNKPKTNKYYYNKDNSNHKGLIIPVSIVAVVVTIGTLTAIWFYLTKLKKSNFVQNIIESEQSMNNNNTQTTNINRIK